MSGCRYVRKRLSPYLDGELSRREREKVERHLAACPACRKELVLLKETVLLVSQLPPVKEQQEIAPEVIARIRNRKGKISEGRSFFPLIPKASTLIAALIILTALSSLFYLYYHRAKEKKSSKPVALLTEKERVGRVPKPVSKQKGGEKKRDSVYSLEEPLGKKKGEIPNKGKGGDKHFLEKEERLASDTAKKESAKFVKTPPLAPALEGEVAGEKVTVSVREEVRFIRLVPKGGKEVKKGRLAVHFLDLTKEGERGTIENPIALFADPLLPLIEGKPETIELPDGRSYPKEVILKLTVSPEGRVVKADLELGSGDPLLDRSIVEAVAKWRFSPLKIGGRGVYASGRLSLKLIPAGKNLGIKERKNEK